MGVHGYALVFSIVSSQSFDRIVDVNEALLNALGDAPNVPRVLVGSMHDLAEQRQISTQVTYVMTQLDNMINFYNGRLNHPHTIFFLSKNFI